MGGRFIFSIMTKNLPIFTKSNAKSNFCFKFLRYLIFLARSCIFNTLPRQKNQMPRNFLQKRFCDSIKVASQNKIYLNLLRKFSLISNRSTASESPYPRWDFGFVGIFLRINASFFFQKKFATGIWVASAHDPVIR